MTGAEITEGCNCPGLDAWASLSPLSLSLSAPRVYPCNRHDIDRLPHSLLTSGQLNVTWQLKAIRVKEFQQKVVSPLTQRKGNFSMRHFDLVNGQGPGQRDGVDSPIASQCWKQCPARRKGPATKPRLVSQQVIEQIVNWLGVKLKIKFKTSVIQNSQG